MKKSRLILGNWKMNLLHAQALALADQVAGMGRSLATNHSEVVIGICPPVVYLLPIGQALSGSAVMLGGQDCHALPSGAHTGDISAAMLKDAGCQLVLVGHSERRAAHHETSEMVREKAEAAIAAGLHVVICIGEKLEQREAGTYFSDLEMQLVASFPKGASWDRVSIAYEPIWAIGTGKTASAKDIEEVHTGLCAVLADICGEATPRILYGGSVNAKNALEILSIPVVDGVLVGGASLKSEEFSEIVEAAVNASAKLS